MFKYKWIRSFTKENNHLHEYIIIFIFYLFYAVAFFFTMVRRLFPISNGTPYVY